MCRSNSFPQVRSFKPHNGSRMYLLTWGIYGFAQYNCSILLDRTVQKKLDVKGLDGPMINFYDSTAHFWLSQAYRQHWQEFKKHFKQFFGWPARESDLLRLLMENGWNKWEPIQIGKLDCLKYCSHCSGFGSVVTSTCLGRLPAPLQSVRQSLNYWQEKSKYSSVSFFSLSIRTGLLLPAIPRSMWMKRKAGPLHLPLVRASQ